MTMTPAEANKNRYLGRTDSMPRPTWTGAFRPGGEAELKADQAAWDAAARWDADEKARRAAFLDGLDAKKEAEEKARRDADAERQVDALRKRYLAADPTATPEDFERDRPEILRQQRIAAALDQPGGQRDAWLSASRGVI